MTLYATFVWEDFKLDMVKQIVARFINVEPASINQDTLINYKTVRSSIMLHRMYAALADSGAIVANPSAIKTYGELLEQISSRRDKHRANKEYQTHDDAVHPAISRQEFDAGALDVGIDIEDINNIPVPIDCKSNAFFTNNFSESEIDYCMKQVNPRESFASRFCLKEALVKADNTLMNTSFNKLHIEINAKGAPVYPGYVLSCSHSQGQVVAIAIRSSGQSSRPPESINVSSEKISELLSMQSRQFDKKFSMLVKLFVFVTSLLLVIQLFIFNH
jgi:phosphopantetheine--protein transferase-like protein